MVLKHFGEVYICVTENSSTFEENLLTVHIYIFPNLPSNPTKATIGNNKKLPATNGNKLQLLSVQAT